MALHPYYHVDFCTGSGMLGEAVKLALGGQLRTVAYVEREAYAAATIVARMEDSALDRAPVWSDVKRTAKGEFLDYVQGFRPLCLTAGYPCQPFSLAGSRLGEADERHLWPAIDEFVGAEMPEFCFFENVPGHVSLGLGTVIGDLRERGYRVAAGLFSAAEVGASHERLRLFILAVLGDSMRERRTERQDERRSAHAGIFEAGQREETGDGCAALGNPTLRQDHERRPGSMGETQSGRRCFDATANDASGNMADAEKPGLQGRITARDSGADGCAGQCGELPLFAPGPTDSRWQEILTAYPQVEPAVCRVANGLASGMDADRLRITGNGVSPLAAAFAFVALAARLCGE